MAFWKQEPEDLTSSLFGFQAQWNLDDRCIEFLSAQAPEVVSQVIQDFSHSADQTNASARCMSFTKAVKNGVNARGSAVAAGGGTALVGFQEKWELDERCMEFLLTLSEQVQEKVAEQFEHQPGQTNASARCMAFAKGIMQKQAPNAGGNMVALMQFQATWGLDDRVTEYIGTLPPQVQQTVIMQFEHGPGQDNPSARCRAFARVIAQKAEAQGGAVSNMLHGAPTPNFQRPAPKSLVAKRQQAPMSSNELQIVLPKLQQMWGLDDRCMQFLSTLPPQVVTTVAQEFEHKPGQTNASARCMAFAKSVTLRQGVAQMGDSALEPLYTFQASFGLDDRCTEYLATLPAEVQEKVMVEFTHGVGQSNVSARCMAFAKGIMARAGSVTSDFATGAAAGGAWGSAGGAAMGSKRTYAAAFGQNASANSLAHFQAKYGLDEKCIANLSSMPEHVVAKVVQEFEHKPGQTNASARCSAFAKLVFQSTTKRQGF